MANAAIYWYPDPTGTLERIDLADRLTDAEIAFDCDYVAGRSLGGGVYGQATAPDFGVRVKWSKVSISANTALYAQLYALQSHYSRGGLIYVVDDTSKAYLSASSGSEVVERWQAGFATRGNVVGVWDTLSLTAGDLMMLHGSSPDFQYEMQKLATYATSGMRRMVFTATGGADQAVRNTYTKAPTVVRYHRFWPCCRRPEGESGQIVHEDHGRLYDLDMPLVIDLEAMSLIATAGQDAFKGTSIGSKPSADKYLEDVWGT